MNYGSLESCEVCICLFCQRVRYRFREAEMRAKDHAAQPRSCCRSSEVTTHRKYFPIKRCKAKFLNFLLERDNNSYRGGLKVR